ncbi:MAG: MotA/TolQ/ExbB proton channel family protein [Candidatus Kapabacteria bacterium]|nr:MotA/TolQ/ExbB proton channel family protein [Candidatus Kapabacteria bacterium]
MKLEIEYIPYGLLIVSFIYSEYYLRKAKRTPDKINPYLLESIPQVFPTLGILGTFMGIAYGLYFFDTDNMNQSIPVLLEGLKTAFIASIAGVLGLLYFQKRLERIQWKYDKDKGITNDELKSLNVLIDITKKSSQENSDNFRILNNSLIGDADESLATQFAKMKNQMTEQTDKLSKIQSALGGDNETSLLTQIQKLRAEQNEYAKLISTNSTFIVDTMNKNNEIIKTKFDEFTKLLTENNTKALVEAMEKVITDFNSQMNELIQRLVKENFEELNNSVKNLNDWQRTNKEQVTILISQFNQVTSNLELTSKNIQEISRNTESLTSSNSSLGKMITELQAVLVEDRKFTSAIDNLHKATKSVETSSTELANYMKKEKRFQESITQLLEKLKEIETIKDTNKEFWKDIENKMSEGVSIIAKGNEKLAADVTKLDNEFKKRLSESFMSLDKVLQAMVLQYQKKTIEVINERKL